MTDHPLDEAAETIARRYRRARKIVEVGVGRNPHVARRLTQLLPHIEIILVDKDPEAVEYLGRLGFKAVRDDVARPDPRLYGSADLIYSIHPPPELIPHLIRLAESVGSDLMVKPLSEDAYLAGLRPCERIGGLYLLVSRGENP